MKTAALLKTEILSQVWPSGVPENLVTIPAGATKSAYDNLFDEAFAEIAKWVDSEQVAHVDVRPFCATWYKCGMTVFPAPVGVIHRVGAIVTGAYCGPVWFRHSPWPAPEWMGGKLAAAYNDSVTFPVPTLDLGFAPASSGADSASRALLGIWALHRKNIYMAPWIQSTESVIIEWDGIKLEWVDADLVTDTVEYRKAVKLYFQYAHERDYGSFDKSLTYHNPQKTGSFDEALGDLMWQERANTIVRPERLDPDMRDALPLAAATAVVTPPGYNTYSDFVDTVTGITYRMTIADGQLTVNAV